jgi:formylglycine-generating enzyme
MIRQTVFFGTILIAAASCNQILGDEPGRLRPSSQGTSSSGGFGGFAGFSIDAVNSSGQTGGFGGAPASICGDGIIGNGETCDDGYTLDNDGCSSSCGVEVGYACVGMPSVCADIDECSNGTHNCDAHATCTNAPGAFACACHAGYMGDGVTCTPGGCNGTVPNTCGLTNDQDCCVTDVVLGGTFKRDNSFQFPATVSSFRLDRFEVTVGRFRKFLEAYPGSKPDSGDGKHPLLNNSGWNTSWNSSLPGDQGDLRNSIECSSTFQTWTDSSGANENKPINCVTWYVAFAYCAWNGGRLPTELEWNYAAAGGNNQRFYPWSEPADSTTIDKTIAVYDCMGDGSSANNCSNADIQAVGSRAPGISRWKQFDLGGNVSEWALDSYGNYPSMCANCALVPYFFPDTNRVLRGGSFRADSSELSTNLHDPFPATTRSDEIGFRCARSL